MTAEAWIALAALATTIVAVCTTAAYVVSQREAGARRERLQAAHAAERVELQQQIARLEHDLERESTRSQEANAELEAITREHQSLLQGRPGAVLKHEIDREILHTMEILRAQAASVLVEAPLPNDQTSLVFLSAFGPAAKKIRKELVPKASKAGKVLESGRVENTRNPRGDAEWNPTVDAKGEFRTTSLLTVPVKLRNDQGNRTLAVCQFLNKRDQPGFSEHDEEFARSIASRIAPQVHEFLSDERNYQVLGIPLEQPDQDAAVMVCDLTSSTDLLDRMNTPSAILRLDEYLEHLGDIALSYGAKLVVSLGDGMMFSFNVPKPLDDHVHRALDAAWAMQRDFGRIWNSWQFDDLGHLHSRISITAGKVVLATVGPKLFRHETVFGPVVNLSSKLCHLAPRDRDVIVVDDEVMKQTASYYRFVELELPETAPGLKAPQRMHEVVEKLKPLPPGENDG